MKHTISSIYLEIKTYPNFVCFDLSFSPLLSKFLDAGACIKSILLINEREYLHCP